MGQLKWINRFNLWPPKLRRQVSALGHIAKKAKSFTKRAITRLFKVYILIPLIAALLGILGFMLSRPIVEIEDCQWYKVKTLAGDWALKFKFILHNKGLRPAKELLRKEDIVIRISIPMKEFPNFIQDISYASEKLDLDKEKRLWSYEEYRKKVVLEILHFFEKKYSGKKNVDYIENYFKSKWQDSSNILEVYGEVKEFFPRPKTLGPGDHTPDGTGRSVGRDIEENLINVPVDAITLFLEYEYKDWFFPKRTYCIAYFDRILSGSNKFFGEYQMSIYKTCTK